MKSILYADEVIIDKEKHYDEMIYIETKLSHKNIKYINLKYNDNKYQMNKKLDKLLISPFNNSIIGKNDLWSKMNHFDKLNVDKFIYGYISYISLFVLLEDKHFVSTLPFKFELPCCLEDGDCSNYHILKYMYQPIHTMSEILDSPLHYYFKNISKFINRWVHIFQTGPEINSIIINNLNVEFNGNIELVIAAYNGGRGNVQKWLNNKEYSADGKTLINIPFKETDKYVKKVKTNYNIYLKLYNDGIKATQ